MTIRVSGGDLAARIMFAEAEGAAAEGPTATGSAAAPEVASRRDFTTREVANIFRLELTGGGVADLTSAAPTAGPDPHVHQLDGFPTHDQNQGDGGERACGTTSLWSILDYWNPGAAGNDRFSIDHAIRRGNVGASADDLVSYAEDHGYRAAVKDDASLDDLRSMIDQGVPVMCNIDPDGGDNWNLHWIDVVGYTTDDAGQITSLKIMDPSGGQIRDVDVDTFMRQWSDIHVGGISSGVNREMLTFIPNDDRAVKGLDGVTRRASDIDLPSNGGLGDVFSDAKPSRVLDDSKAKLFNGWDKLRSGEIFGGLGDELGMLVGFVGAGIGFALTSFVGRNLEGWGASAIDWANDQWANGGFLGKLGAIGAWLVGGLTAGVGWLCAKAGDLLSSAAGAVGDALDEVGGAIDAGLRAVGDAVSSAWDTVTSWF